VSTIASAQDAVGELLRTHLGPRLRALGFKGSGASWSADRPGFLVGLGVQRSVHGDRRETQLTINVTVVSIETWTALLQERPYLSARPAPNTRYGPAVWQRRIGLLLPERSDRWWSVGPDTDLAALAEDVAGAIAAHVLPAIDRAAT
jgi:hypothetical protein